MLDLYGGRPLGFTTSAIDRCHPLDFKNTNQTRQTGVIKNLILSNKLLIDMSERSCENKQTNIFKSSMFELYLLQTGKKNCPGTTKAGRRENYDSKSE